MEKEIEYELSLIDGEERKKYAKKHGIGSLINLYHGLPWDDNESEKIYKYCNEHGITWEQYYNFKSDSVIF